MFTLGGWVHFVDDRHFDEFMQIHADIRFLPSGVAFTYRVMLNMRSGYTAPICEIGMLSMTK